MNLGPAGIVWSVKPQLRKKAPSCAASLRHCLKQQVKERVRADSPAGSKALTSQWHTQPSVTSIATRSRRMIFWLAAAPARKSEQKLHQQFSSDWLAGPVAGGRATGSGSPAGAGTTARAAGDRTSPRRSAFRRPTRRGVAGAAGSREPPVAGTTEINPSRFRKVASTGQDAASKHFPPTESWYISLPSTGTR